MRPVSGFADEPLRIVSVSASYRGYRRLDVTGGRVWPDVEYDRNLDMTGSRDLPKVGFDRRNVTGGCICPEFDRKIAGTQADSAEHGSEFIHRKRTNGQFAQRIPEWLFTGKKLIHQSFHFSGTQFFSSGYCGFVGNGKCHALFFTQ